MLHRVRRPVIIDPRVLAQQIELDALIEGAINNAPRSLQTRIGPSGLGIPCMLKLGYQLSDHPRVNAPTEQALKWKAWIGTNVHGGIEEVLTRANMALPSYAADGIERYHLEQRITVGQINGTDISGNADLYLDGTVWDWKIPGGNMLRKYRAEGPGDTYRIQAHLYGAGWVAKGFDVRHVAIYFLPRDQEWTQRYLWSEPFDPAVAEAALSRADGISKLIADLGVDALPLLKRAESWCRWCEWRKPGSKDLAKGCPGDPDAAKKAAAEFEDLIA